MLLPDNKVLDNKDFYLEIKEIEKLLMLTQILKQKKMLLDKKLSLLNILKLFSITILQEEKIEI